MVSSTRRRRPEVAAIRRDLDADLITVEQAIERVIEDAVQERVPAHYSEETREACRAFLRHIARTDPHMRARVRMLRAAAGEERLR